MNAHIFLERSVNLQEHQTRTKVAVINLPHAEKLIRRYMCTYKSPFFCFPPHDLLQVATCIREWSAAEVVFLDCIADDVTESDLILFLTEHRPGYLVTLLGVESVATDLACASRIRAAFPEMRLIVFGYYATQYPREILEKTLVDVVLRGDPEESCCSVITDTIRGIPPPGIPGVACRDEQENLCINPPAYLESLAALPAPDYTLATIGRYSEMLLGGPFAAIQTSRGCQFSCDYCTSPRDKRLVLRTVHQAVDEMEALVGLGVRVIRFLDDTFTFDAKRVIAICQEILRRKICVDWSCLARVDTLNAEVLQWMKKAGCVRVVVGIESYSPRVLEVFGKRIQVDNINQKLGLLKEAGIESIGFIIVGGPFESQEDFELTHRGLLESPLDLAIIDTIALYGGTPLLERFKEAAEFQLIPYVSQWRDPEVVQEALNRERILYRKFYFRPKTILRLISRLFRFPGRSVRIFLLLAGFILRPLHSRDRKDLF